MKNKKDNLPARLFLLAAILYYISALLAFVSKNTGNGVTYLCLGSTFLALSVVYAKKNTESKDEESKETESAEEAETTEETEATEETESQ